MLIEEIKHIDSSKKELRKFGISVGLVLFLIGLLFQFVWDSQFTFYILSGIGLFLVLFGIVQPTVLLPLHKVWMTLALILGFIMTRVILSILFYIIVTFIGLIAKLVKKDFLDRKIDRDKESYWHKREKVEYHKELTERQF